MFVTLFCSVLFSFLPRILGSGNPDSRVVKERSQILVEVVSVTERDQAWGLTVL